MASIEVIPFLPLGARPGFPILVLLIVSVARGCDAGDEACAGSRHEEDSCSAKDDTRRPEAPRAEEVAQDAPSAMPTAPADRFTLAPRSATTKPPALKSSPTTQEILNKSTFSASSRSSPLTMLSLISSRLPSWFLRSRVLRPQFRLHRTSSLAQAPLMLPGEVASLGLRSGPWCDRRAAPQAPLR